MKKERSVWDDLDLLRHAHLRFSPATGRDSLSAVV
jgi:hypothetical protein